MKCLVGFQKHLLVKPVTTEGFITRSEKMLFPRKPLSKSTFILLFIPRSGICYGLKISTGECPVLEPSQWPVPEETKRGNAEGYTGTMVPKQERNVCARRRCSCMELRHTEALVWHFHQYSTSPLARREPGFTSAAQGSCTGELQWAACHQPSDTQSPEASCAAGTWLLLFPLRWQAVAGAHPAASILLATLRCCSTWVVASELLLFCFPASEQVFVRVCRGTKSRGAALAPGFSAPACSSRAGQGRPSAAEFCSKHLEERELH